VFLKRDHTKLFFASDIHGSERCWRKFLNAGEFYDVDILVMGGDITGKMIVPIVAASSGVRRACYMGREHEFEVESEIQRFEQSVRDNGHYPVKMTQNEAEKYSEGEQKLELFEEVLVDSLSRWVEMAEERLHGTGIQCYVIPGNDDMWIVDDVIDRSEAVINPEGQCVQLDNYHEMIASGYTNPTPWDTYRELPEDDLKVKLETLFLEASDTKNLVASLHAPPYGIGLDAAPMLEEDLSMSRSLGGDVEFVPVGSTAVADVINKYQPMLTLHGHVHESRGVKKMGRTVVVNPGSEYTEGMLSGVIVVFDKSGVRRQQLICG